MAIWRNWSGKGLHCFNQSRLLSFEMCFIVMYRSNWAVSSKNMIEYMDYNVNKSKAINR